MKHTNLFIAKFACGCDGCNYEMRLFILRDLLNFTPDFVTRSIWPSMQRRALLPPDFRNMILTFLTIFLCLTSSTLTAGCNDIIHNKMVLVGKRGVRINIKRPLRNGGNGCLHVGIVERTQQPVAVKTSISPASNEAFRREIRTNDLIKTWFDKTDDPAFVLSVDDGIIDVGDNSDDYDTDHTSDTEVEWMAFPYFPYGDALDYVMNVQPLNFRQLQSLAYNILIGLTQLHTRGLGHFDVKPENILITQEPTEDNIEGKLIDLAFVRKPEDIKQGYMVGTLETMAPEFLLQDLNLPITVLADMWSFGVTMNTLLRTQYLVQTPPESKEAYAHTYRVFKNMAFYQLEEEFGLDFDPTQLPIEDVVNCGGLDRGDLHHYCSALPPVEASPFCYCDLLLSTLRFHPKDRISSEQALNHPFFRLKL